ncbi:hypothetical protein MMX123_02741 [Microbacterium sp. MM2322]|uniref:RHS repeat domain-containing protein n=1 Tax=Microbacterium sp. MM2322 TaxID=3157631 RepID=UPI003D806819
MRFTHKRSFKTASAVLLTAGLVFGGLQPVHAEETDAPNHMTMPEFEKPVDGSNAGETDVPLAEDSSADVAEVPDAPLTPTDPELIEFGAPDGEDTKVEAPAPQPSQESSPTPTTTASTTPSASPAVPTPPPMAPTGTPEPTQTAGPASVPVSVDPMANLIASLAQAESSDPVEVSTDQWVKVGDQPLEISPVAKSSDVAVNVEILDPNETALNDPTTVALAVTVELETDQPKEASMAMRVPIATLSNGFGADYVDRLSWFQVPIPANGVSPDLSKAQKLSTTSDADYIAVTPQAAETGSMVMAVAAASSDKGTGDYSATPLKSSSTWNVTEQTGAFSWNYGFAIPTSGIGPEPALGLAYNSQTVDGQTGSTNNQTSAVGLGWDLAGAGFIERRYVPCAVDDGPSGPVKTSGDLCWKSDNATLSMAGHAGPLVKDSDSDTWRLESDDGTRFQKLTGSSQGCAPNGTNSAECWKMTSTDGTQYFFGLHRLPGWSEGDPTTNSAWIVPVFGNDPGEPCKASTFAASSCMQAWRWNLDYAVDVHGNGTAYYYAAEKNKYARNGSGGASYTRGGALTRVEYGLRSDNLFGSGAAGYRVLLNYDADGRCSDSTGADCTQQTLGDATRPSNTSKYPDVPWDQLCTSTSCSSAQDSPTFFSNARLSTVEAQVLKNGGYSKTDSWELTHSFPDPGDGTNAALWLKRVQHTGSRAGQSPIAEPPTEFSGTTMQNRVWTIDGLAPLTKWRISSIKDTLGAVTSVNYYSTQCTADQASSILASPETNTKWCYPEWWAPKNDSSVQPRLDLFHKYRVSSTSVDDVTGPALSKSMKTQYYYGTPRWRYNNSPLTAENRRTWNQFAGVDTVEVRAGDPNAPSAQSVTKTWYFQGMNGDRASTSGGTKTANVTSSSVPDERWFAGQVYRKQVLLGVGGAVQSSTVSTLWASNITADDGTRQARMVRTGGTLLTEPLSGGGTRTVETTTTFDDTTGLPKTMSVEPSDATPTCVTTQYTNANIDKWLIGLVQETRTIARPCDALSSAVYPQDLLSRERTAYDGANYGDVPSRGLATKKEAVTKYSSGQPVWGTVSSSTYDALGRPLVVSDPMGRTSTSGYSPSSALPLTSSTSTNTAPFNWVATTTFDVSTGVGVKVTDANGAVTSTQVDALGRTSKVWLPLRPRAANESSPSLQYDYTLSRTSPNAIKTTVYKAGSNVSEWALFDGIGRVVQTQGSATGGGTVISTTAYDDQGRAYLRDNPYWSSSVDPGTSLFVPDSQNAVPSSTSTVYDAVGRETKVTTIGMGDEKLSSVTSYIGADRKDTTPPSGGTPTTTVTNTLGQQTKLIQYLSSSTSGTGQVTTYSHDAAGHLTSMTDPAGNVWTWTYDMRGFRIAQTDPDAGTSFATYDAVGNLTSTTDARGQKVTNTYDALDRKTATYSGTSSGSLLARWTYDSVRKGLVTSSTSYVGSVPGDPGGVYVSKVEAYDAGGNATRTTTTIPSTAPAFGGTSFTTTAGFYSDSSPSVKTMPSIGGLSTEQVIYSYDGWGRLSGIGGNGGILNSTVYSPTGQISQFNRSNNGDESYSTYAYDAVTGLVSNIKDNAVFNDSGHWAANRSYARDGAGNVTSITTTAVIPTQTKQVNCYKYDALREMRRVWTPASTSDCGDTPTTDALSGPAPMWKEYTYDTESGNRTKVVSRSASGASNTSTYAYPAGGESRPHAVSTITGSASAGGGSYSYDESGNTTARPGQSIEYDAMGRVEKVTLTSTGATQENIYGALGSLLMSKDADGDVTLFLGDTTLVKSADSGKVTSTRVYKGPGNTPIAQRSAQSGVNGSVVSWLFVDINGTVDTRTVASSGQTTKQYRDPFGLAASGSSGVWADGTGFLNKPASLAVGLTTVGARSYDPRIGKFISVDPVVNPTLPQQNLGYAYAGNNPISWTDPTGLYLMANDSCTPFRGCRSAGAAPTRPSPAPGVNPPPAWGLSRAVGVGLGKAATLELASGMGSSLTGMPWVLPGHIENAEKLKNLSSILTSEQGAMVWGWATGNNAKTVYYGENSMITEGIRNVQETKQFVEEVRLSIKNNQELPKDRRYDAGLPIPVYNDNFNRDLATFKDWGSASNTDRTLAAVGSFSLDAVVRKTSDHSARVTFSAENPTTLGSAISPLPSLRPFINSIPDETGMFSETHQIYTWTQELTF